MQRLSKKVRERVRRRPVQRKPSSLAAVLQVLLLRGLPSGDPRCWFRPHAPVVKIRRALKSQSTARTARLDSSLCRPPSKPGRRLYFAVSWRCLQLMLLFLRATAAFAQLDWGNTTLNILRSVNTSLCYKLEWGNGNEAGFRPVSGMPLQHPLVNGNVSCPGYTYSAGASIPVTGNWWTVTGRYATRDCSNLGSSVPGVCALWPQPTSTLRASGHASESRGAGANVLRVGLSAGGFSEYRVLPR
jgi:hypothetical protein